MRSVAGGQCLDLVHVGVQHADGCLQRRPRRVPDGAVARDGELGLICDLRGGVVRELLRALIETDQRSSLTSVTDPDGVLAVCPHVVRLRERHGDVVLDDLAAGGIDPADLAVDEVSVPDYAARIDAQPADRARLRGDHVLRELLGARIELADLAAPELGEPDDVVTVEIDPVGSGTLRRHLPHGRLARLPVPLADHVALDYRERHVLLRVHHGAVPATSAPAAGIHRIPHDAAGRGIELPQVEAGRLRAPGGTMAPRSLAVAPVMRSMNEFHCVSWYCLLGKKFFPWQYMQFFSSSTRPDSRG